MAKNPNSNIKHVADSVITAIAQLYFTTRAYNISGSLPIGLGLGVLVLAVFVPKYVQWGTSLSP